MHAWFKTGITRFHADNVDGKAGIVCIRWNLHEYLVGERIDPRWRYETRNGENGMLQVFNIHVSTFNLSTPHTMMIEGMHKGKRAEYSRMKIYIYI